MVVGVARCGRDRCGSRWLYSATKASISSWSSAIVAGWSGWERSHFFMVCWKRSALPQVVGWLGRELCWITPRRRSSASSSLRPPLPPENRVVNTIVLSVSVEAGIPCVATASRKVASTIGPVTRWWAVTDSANRAWSSSQDKISVSLPGRAVGSGEPVVGDISLPAAVGLLGLEPDVGGLRPLLRLRDHQPPPGQVTGHGGPGHGDAVVVGQVPADRVRARVQAGIGELLAQPDDQVHRLRRDRIRRGLRPPGTRLEDRLALGAIARQQLIEPGLRDAVLGGDMANRTLLDHHSGDQQTGK